MKLYIVLSESWIGGVDVEGSHTDKSLAIAQLAELEAAEEALHERDADADATSYMMRESEVEV